MDTHAEAIDRIVVAMRSMQGGAIDRLPGQLSSIQDLDFTLPQFMVLHFLRLRRATPLTVSELAAIINLSQPATSQLIDRLLKRGLLGRRENPDDRRQKLISITDSGVALLERIERAREERLRATFAQMPLDQLIRLENVLNEVADIIKSLPLPTPSEPAAHHHAE